MQSFDMSDLVANCVPFLHVDLVTADLSTNPLPVIAVFSEALAGNGKQQTRLRHLVQHARAYVPASALCA